jgi:hypothetical protein
VARTWNVWLPPPSAGEIVCGLEHADQPPPSTRHSKLEPGSVALKANAGVASFDGSAGLESIVVFGAVRSIVHV